MNRAERVIAWILRTQDYVPDPAAHRVHDAKVMVGAHPAGFHVWVATAAGEHCSFCGRPRPPRQEPARRIREHPGGVTWAICDLRALDRAHPVVLAGPFPHFDMLRDAMPGYLRSTASPCSVRCSTREAFAGLCDPATGLDLLVEALTRQGREQVVAA